MLLVSHLPLNLLGVQESSTLLPARGVISSYRTSTELLILQFPFQHKSVLRFQSMAMLALQEASGTCVPSMQSVALLCQKIFISFVVDGSLFARRMVPSLTCYMVLTNPVQQAHSILLRRGSSLAKKCMNLIE